MAQPAGTFCFERRYVRRIAMRSEWRGINESALMVHFHAQYDFPRGSNSFFINIIMRRKAEK